MCVLFILFTEGVEVQWAHRFVEFFSGSGKVTWCLKSSGFCGIQFDQDFGGRFNNIFEPAGFARLCCNHWSSWMCMLSVNTFCLLLVSPFLRCAVLSILRLFPGSLVILAPVCSSFSYMCSSQSRRLFYMPEGDESFSWVKEGNVMSCRVTLLCWLCSALGLVFIVEQPGSEKFGQMPRWQHFCSNICYVFRLQTFFAVVV